MMDHPNIAKVFDAGTTESGRPYFVDGIGERRVVMMHPFKSFLWGKDLAVLDHELADDCGTFSGHLTASLDIGQIQVVT